MEDEFLIRLEAADCIRDSGYQVVEAADAGEALEILRGSNFEIDLLVTDITLPGGMDGRALAAWVRNNRPGTPVLLATAYGSRTDEAVENVAYLAKPYTGRALVEKVKSALARRAQ